MNWRGGCGRGAGGGGGGGGERGVARGAEGAGRCSGRDAVDAVYVGKGVTGGGGGYVQLNSTPCCSWGIHRHMLHRPMQCVFRQCAGPCAHSDGPEQMGSLGFGTPPAGTARWTARRRGAASRAPPARGPRARLQPAARAAQRRPRRPALRATARAAAAVGESARGGGAAVRWRRRTSRRAPTAMRTPRRPTPATGERACWMRSIGVGLQGGLPASHGP